MASTTGGHDDVPSPAVAGLLLALAPDRSGGETQTDHVPGRRRGQTAAGWKADQTNEGKGSVWKVLAERTAPSGSGYVLADGQRSQRVVQPVRAGKSKFHNGEISVRVKAVKGKKDQGGGLVWRYRDANNYYVARYNPLEDNFRVYKVVNGKRIGSPTKENIVIPAGKWFQVTVRQTGNRIECLLDGKPYLDVKDDTFTEAGKVGLWSKADAVSNFDEVVITSSRERSLATTNSWASYFAGSWTGW